MYSKDAPSGPVIMTWNEPRSSCGVYSPGMVKNSAALPPRMSEEGDGDGNRTADGRVIDPAVELAHAGEGAVDAGGEAAFAFPVIFVALEELGGHHRRDGERDQHREGDGRSDGDREFREQAAHLALHEGDGDEHGDQDERGGDDGEADLARAAIGGDEGRLALFLDAAVDVLQHDDGVVDDKADGHDEGEQRQHVDR